MVSSLTRGTPPLLTVRTRACPSQQDGYPLQFFAEGKALSQLSTGRLMAVWPGKAAPADRNTSCEGVGGAESLALAERPT